MDRAHELRERTLYAARAIEQYADGEILCETAQDALYALAAVEPDPQVIDTYRLDRGRLHALTTEQLHTLATDYRAMAESPPETHDPQPVPSGPATPRSYFNPLTESPSRVTIVGGDWDGAKGTDSGQR